MFYMQIANKNGQFFGELKEQLIRLESGKIVSLSQISLELLRQCNTDNLTNLLSD